MNTQSIFGIGHGCGEKHSLWQDINNVCLGVKKIPPYARNCPDNNASAIGLSLNRLGRKTAK
jgi:hypothetical protein